MKLSISGLRSGTNEFKINFPMLSFTHFFVYKGMLGLLSLDRLGVFFFSFLFFPFLPFI